MRFTCQALLVALSLGLAGPAAAQAVLGGTNLNNNPPVNSIGNESQYYIDWASGRVYGPKTLGVWPLPFITTLSTSTTGPSGPAGGVLTGTYPNPTFATSAAVSSQFLTGTSAGAFTRAQPAIADISGWGTGVATALGVNVGTAGSPVVNGGALGTPSSGTLTNATGLPISTGVFGLGTGTATALSNAAGGAGGFALVGTTPPTGAAGGDLTGTYPNPTLAAVLVAGGPIGSATVAPIITYDAKGRLTVVSSATITPAIGSVTGLGTGIATALGVNIGLAGAPILFNGAAGTPTSLVGTNITGTAAGLTAGNVTTNANLTGDVTSVGNAATLATSQTGAHTWSGSNNFTSTFQIGGNTQTFPAVAATLTQTIASGAQALTTTAIASGACTAAQTATATGTATTDVVSASFNGDPTAVTGYIPSTSGMLTIIAYPTLNTVNFKVCNNTSASITPGAVTINWRVVR